MSVLHTRGPRQNKAHNSDLVAGKIRMNRQGKGFFQPEDPNLSEIAIPQNATSTAFHEDRVLVRRNGKSASTHSRANGERTGTVVRVLERKRMTIVGTLQERQRSLYVIPDDPRMPYDISVAVPRDVGRPAYPGDKVVVELREWESRNANPNGEIIEVLGAPDEEGVDMLSVLRQYDLPLHFPKNVLQEARSFGAAIQQAELQGRIDCRAHQVITIDPDDAKDFDDAICLQRLPNDQWRLWVHIADVSHYVKPGSALDIEARKRGNSTYLVDRVIPMLPEALSNELCSLKPNVDRLTKCVEFLISNEGRVLNTNFYSAVIHSKQRFSYKEVLAMLQRQPRGAVEDMLHQANALAQRIRRSRFKAGSLDLDFPETKIRLDDRGRVLRIDRVENDISHQLIEEYMLLANEAVATRLMSQQQRAIFRVHEEPDEERLQEFREEVISHNIPCGNLRDRREVQKLLQKLNTLAIGPALKIGFLKSLMRARYAVEALGHYGLAKTKYTHFTSPIRRYADLVVHRALFKASHGSAHSLKQTAEHISDTERNSADAERASKDVKLFAYLRAQLESSEPTRYSGLVIDVRAFGFFVDVPELGMSGLVPLTTLEDDFYVFDAARNHLVGRRTRRIIRLGDKLEVQVAKVDTFKRQVDFQPARTSGSREPFRKGSTPKNLRFVTRTGQGSKPRPSRERRQPQQQSQAPARSSMGPGGTIFGGGRRGPQSSRRPKGRVSERRHL